jgi:hypothetical protein
MALRRRTLLVSLFLLAALVLSKPVYSSVTGNISLTDTHSVSRQASVTSSPLSPEILGAIYSVQGANVPELIVPEPGTMLLLGTGLLGLIATVLRQQFR